MSKTVKDLINYLEILNPNESIACWLYTKEDIQGVQNYADGNPYTDELAERVIDNLREYDSITDTIHDAIQSEISNQVHHTSKPKEIASY